jgi:hypothetical protein
MAAESNVAGCIVFGFGIAIASGLGESKLGILHLHVGYLFWRSRVH